MKKRFLVILFVLFISICYFSTRLIALEPTSDAGQIADQSGTVKSSEPLRLWVPYDPKNPDDLLNLKENFIFIDYNDLQAIQNSKNPVKRYSGPPPVNYQLNSVSYFASVNGDYINVQGVYSINKLDNEWVLIPVISDQVGISTSTLNGKPAFLTNYNSGQDFSKFQNYSQISSGYQFIAIKNRGIHNLKVNFTVKKVKDPTVNTESFNFSIPNVSIINLGCFVANQKNIEFDVPSSISKSIKSTEKGTFLSATMPPIQNIEVKWNPKSESLSLKHESDSTIDPSINSSVYTKIEIGRGSLTGTTTFDLDIRHQAMNHFEFLLPNDVEIDSVSADNGIEVSDPYPEIKNGRLDVDLNSNVEGKVLLKIKFRKNFDDSSFKTSIPYITLDNKNVERENGYIALKETTNIETNIIKSDPSKDYQEIDPSELPGILSGIKASISFKYTKTKQSAQKIPYDILIDVQKHQDVAVYEANIESTNIISVINEQGQLFTKATFNVRNTKKQFLDISLPKKSTIWSVYVDGKSTKPAVKDESKLIYSIPLAKSASNDKGGKEFPVEVVYMTDSGFFPPTWLIGITGLNTISTELSTNYLEWLLYVPYDSRFVPLELFSNLQKTNSSIARIDNERGQFLDGVLGGSYNAKKAESDSVLPAPAAESVQQTRLSEESKAQADYSRIESNAIQKDKSPSVYEPQKQAGFRQELFQGRKIGKMPVYIYLPQIGNTFSFYQLSFQSNKMPFIPVLYMSNFIYNALVTLLIITLIIGIPYIVIKNKYKSWKYLLISAIIAYILFNCISLMILLPVYISAIIVSILLIKGIGNKTIKNRFILLSLLIFAILGLFIAFIIHPPMLFLLVSIFIFAVIIFAVIALIVWLFKKIIRIMNKKKVNLKNIQADKDSSSNMEGQNNE